MKLIHPLAWLFFIGVLSFDIFQYIDLVHVQGIPGNLFGLPLLSSAEASAQLFTWASFPTRAGGTVLDATRLNTQWDFLFIVGYVSILIILSYNQMQRESRPWLNTLLRFGFLLAIVGGIFDAIENVFLLADMTPYNAMHHCYYSPFVFSVGKFVFGGWVLVVWLFSLVTAKQRAWPQPIN